MTSEPLRITIFHTNDMHGSLDGMARLSSLCRRLRAEAEAGGRKTFFFDAGDAADRRITIVSSSKGAVFGPILNAMNFDLQALGNDIALTYGPQCIPAYAARLDFPLLAANFRNGRGPLLSGVTATSMLDLPRGYHMAVVGLTPQAADIYSLFGIVMEDPTPALVELVGHLRANGADLVVLLSHSGLREDHAFAEAVPGIDLIIGGHSHTLLENGEVENGVLIAQAGDYARYLGRIDLDYDPVSRKVLNRSARLIAVPEDETPDPVVLKAITDAETEAREINTQIAGNLLDPLELDYFHECSIGDFTADALRARMGSQIAIVTSGIFHSGLPAGTITLGQLRQACFSTANPAVTELTGEQILSALEIGLTPETYEFMFTALRGAPIGIPQISGMKVWFDPEGENGSRIRHVEVQGESLDRQRVYTVAHTDLETFRYGCIRLQPGQQSRYELPTIINEVMLDAINAAGGVRAPANGRWIDIRRSSD